MPGVRIPTKEAAAAMYLEGLPAPGGRPRVRIPTKEEADAILESLGGKAAVLESHRRFEENRKYVEAHSEELTARYPDEWICVAGRRVVSHADSPEEAVRLFDESGEPRGGMFMQHLPTEPVVWLL